MAMYGSMEPNDRRSNTAGKSDENGDGAMKMPRFRADLRTGDVSNVTLDPRKDQAEKLRIHREIATFSPRKRMIRIIQGS
ncbi:MAG: hypothetical protein IT440_02505 [Phycisphaeraceae bacterium]|nr:hypothetical protein [Phycisphaeraceae bacterium]